MRILNIFFKIICKALKRLSFLEFSYSQEGEDLVLSRFVESFGNFPTTYIDIGAHHPKRFSNTYFYYLKSWKGLCVDPIPGVAKDFKSERPLDKFLNYGVGSKDQSLTYHVFDDQALNTFSTGLAEDRLKNTRYKLIKKIEVNVKPLSMILDREWTLGEIGFLSVDAEGLDLDILKSNNWDSYRPYFILAEELDKSSSEVEVYLKSVGYRRVANTFNTIFFKRDDL